MTLAAAAVAEERPAPEIFGTWTLTHEVLADGKAFCRLSRTWPAAFYMEFASFGPGRPPVLSVVNPRWNIAEKAVTPITFEVDASTRHTLSMTRVSARQVLAGSADDSVTWVVDHIATGKAMSILLPGGESVSLDPDSLAAARASFLKCATAWAGQTQGAAAREVAPPTPAPRGNGGTGFAVTHDGTLVTNAHVIAGCPQISVGKRDHALPAVVLAEDKGSDLAALHVEGLTFEHVAAIAASETVALGERAVTFGFPLYGALSTDGNFTLGYVSALTGMHDDARYIQISTPVQPGNSGGPVLNGNGDLIGVISSKLDAGRMLMIAGDAPENINFAIKAETLRLFLQAHNIPIVRAPAKRSQSNIELAALGRDIAVHIDCRG